MPILKEQLKEEIKKQLFQQLLEQKMVDEGVTDFLKSMGQKALSGVSSVAKKGADALQTVDVDEKKLDKIADFLQIAQRDPEISKLILTTKLGKAILGGEEQNKSLQEILTGNFVQMMKAKKITNADIDAFIKAMSANAKASKMLKDLEIDVSQVQADKSSTPSQDQPSQQTAQTQSTPPQTQSPEQKQGTQQVVRNLKPSKKGVKDTVGTEEYKKSIQGLSTVISNTLNIPAANAQKIIDDIWNQLGGKNGKFTKLTLLEQEFQLNLTKILQNNGISGLRANNLINKIKQWAKQNSSFVTDKIGQSSIEKNPNPSVEVPRTQSSTIPQPAKPIRILSPAEDAPTVDAVISAIKAVRSGKPQPNSLDVIKSASKIPDNSKRKIATKKEAEKALNSMKWSIARDGEISGADKEDWLKSGGIIIAEDLQKIIVEELIKVLIGK